MAVENHLFIGIGGTGGNVLRELRKRVFEEFGCNEPPADKACLEYLYIDSNDDDLNRRAGWKVLGTSVHLLETQKLSIHGISGGMLDELNQYPGMQCFLPISDVKTIKKNIGPLIEQGIGGQRRRLGRILIANNLAIPHNENDLLSRLNGAVGRLQAKSGLNEVTFHICAGLAGGTGSGSIIDVIAQIRKAYSPGTANYKIMLYLYLPEMTIENPAHDEGFYQANGYAGLLELNALSVHKYMPFDITGEKNIYSGEVKRLLENVDPFEAAYVYSNVNEAGRKLEIGKDLPAAVADFLFQHNVASALLGNEGQLKRLVNCENDGAGPENDKANQPSRSRKFLSFGIKRVEYPETEIKEYAAYMFAQQTARQFTFNKWDSTQGYIEISEEEVGVGFASEIRTQNNRERLKLSNNYLMLQKPIIETKENKMWHDISSTWETRAQNFAEDVINEERNKSSWLSSFNDRIEEYYNYNYRTHGVVKFYEVQAQERLGYAKHIRRHIEKLLFDEWAAGTKSVIEIDKYLSLLITDSEGRIAALKNAISEVETEIRDINEQIKTINKEWNDINWLHNLFGKCEKILGKYKDAKCELYTNMTRIHGYNYAIELLQYIIRELVMAKKGVSNFKQNISAILEEVTKQSNSRCQKESILDDTRTLKKYDPEIVQHLVKSYISTEEMQRDNALAIREQMVNALGDDGEHSFAKLNEKTDYETAINLILDQCSYKANEALENSAKSDESFKMVNVNILEKLKQELNSDDKREEFVKKLVASASTFNQFNSAEMAKASVGNGGKMHNMVMLCIPKWDNDTSGFRDQLIHTFELTCPGFKISDCVAENYRQNQIVVIAAKSGFPLRFLANTTVLKQKYDYLLARTNGEINKILLHTESFKEPLPSLYEVNKNELEMMITKPILLAYALGMIAEGMDPITQEKFHVIDLPDETNAILGIQNLVPLGKNILDTIEILSLDYEKAKQVLDKEKQEFAKIRSNDQKLALQKELGNVLAKILSCPECENNQFSPVYKKYQQIIIELVKQDLALK